jgi:ribosomal protein S27E
MTTIKRLGSHDMAGSKYYPTTYRILSCPRCYGVLYWYKKGQTEVTCDNCETTVSMIEYGGPLGYTKHMILKKLVSWQALLFAIYAVLQVLDHRLHFRKLLLYTYIKVLSYT